MVKDESNSQNRYYTVSLLVVRNLYISQITITTKYHKSIQKHDVAEMGSQNCYLYSIDTPYPPQPFTPFSPIPSDSLHQFVTELQPQRVQRVDGPGHGGSYPPGNDHLSHLEKRKIIDSKVPSKGDMLVPRGGTICWLRQ